MNDSSQSITPLKHVIDATTESFQADVVDASVQTPVLIDFWATWCGPCKSLGPILEKLAAEYNGAFVLAKVDVDKEQQLAGYFQIRSVPTVVLLKDGQIADGFPGALPEGELRAFLAKHGIEPNAPKLEGFEQAAVDDSSATALSPVDPQAEVDKARNALADKPDDDMLKLDLALALTRNADYPEAGALLDALPANLSTDARAEKARACITLLEHVANAASLSDLRSADDVASDPTKLHQLAVRELLQGEPEAGLEHLITLLRDHRDFADGQARKSLLLAFQISDDPVLVGRFRRKMASLLF